MRKRGMEQIVSYRTVHGITRQTLADKLGTSEGYLHDIESGRRKPSLEFAVRIEQVTGIPRQELRPDIFAFVAAAKSEGAAA